MIFKEQSILGVWLISPEPFVDDRGSFRRSFCQREFEAHSINSRVVQANISENSYKHTLRGFHYQKSQHSEDKTFLCLTGSLYVVVVDLRPDSHTFLQWISMEIDSHNGDSVHIPKGCATGFLTLEDKTIVHYYMSEFYSEKAYYGFRYNDPLFKIEWPAEPKIIAERDANYPDFDPDKLS